MVSDARAIAVAALVHRLNGALNNASMALEIGFGDVARTDAQSRETLRAGIAAIGRASRAATLLAYIVQGRSAPRDPDGEYARDVREILREQTRATGGPAPEVNGITGAAEAADVLVAQLARLRRGGD